MSWHEANRRAELIHKDRTKTVVLLAEMRPDGLKKFFDGDHLTIDAHQMTSWNRLSGSRGASHGAERAFPWKRPDLSAADAPTGQLELSWSIWTRKSGDDYGDRFESNSAEVRLFTMTDSIKSREIMEEMLRLSLTSAVFSFVGYLRCRSGLSIMLFNNLDIKGRHNIHPSMSFINLQ